MTAVFQFDIGRRASTLRKLRLHLRQMHRFIDEETYRAQCGHSFRKLARAMVGSCRSIANDPLNVRMRETYSQAECRSADKNWKANQYVGLTNAKRLRKLMLVFIRQVCEIEAVKTAHVHQIWPAVSFPRAWRQGMYIPSPAWCASNVARGWANTAHSNFQRDAFWRPGGFRCVGRARRMWDSELCAFSR